MLSLLAALAFSETLSTRAPHAVVENPGFRFGVVVQGTVVEHEFILRNDGTAPLELSHPEMKAPLLATKLPRTIEPGARSVLRFTLDTASLAGPFDGQIFLSLNDPDQSKMRLVFAGRVAHSIEVMPMPAVYLPTTKGASKEGSVEIINHEPEPIEVLKVENPSATIKTRIEKLEAGRRYRLAVALQPDAPVGRRTDILIVRTSSRKTPEVNVAVNTYVHEKVYTFPEAVDLGDLPLRDLQADSSFLERNAKMLTVYQVGGSRFEVKLSSDLPALVFKAEPAPAGDRWLISITLDRARIQAGPMRGNIVIETNDPEQGRLTVPVSGSILPGPETPS
jgi:hypothetical protein